MEGPLDCVNQLLEILVDYYGNIGHGVQIDENLLIDEDQLNVGPKIAGGPESIIFLGCYKSKPVAIKVVEVLVPGNPSELRSGWKEKFETEVKLRSVATHDNIVKFIGASVHPTVMIITELMTGGTLQKYLMGMHPNRPDLKLSTSFALGISRAMMFLHERGIIHRDLRPNNILLSEDKNTVKIVDFGLAREEIPGEMSTEAGTYRWMAPELFDIYGTVKKKLYNHKVDVYSFSMVLYELLTNNIPFRGRSCISAVYAAATNKRPSTDDIPAEIVPLLESCWAAEPADRPEFSEIVCFLENFIHKLSSPEPEHPKTLEIEQDPSKSNVVEDSPCTDDHVMDDDKPPEANTSKIKTRSVCSRCFSCFFGAIFDEVKE